MLALTKTYFLLFSVSLSNRNNLTVLDVVTVQGQGARGELMINGKRPSGDNVLLFELKQKHLEDCTSMYFTLTV